MQFYANGSKDGSVITATIQRASVTDDDGTIISTIAGVMDVTERIKAKKKLNNQPKRTP